MSLQTTKSRSYAFHGAASGLGSAFFDALPHRRYFAQGQKSSSAGISIYVDGPRGRQCAGHIVHERGRRILRKTRIREAAHYCVKHNGYGCELDALKQAERLGARSVRLVFEDSDRVLEAPLAAFANDGIRDSLGGFGTQVFLPLAFWRDPRDPQGDLFAEVSGDG